MVIVCLALCTVENLPLPAESPAQMVDFGREILPILSNKCFVCHGPDIHDDTELRLDSFDGATADLGGHQAIDPENLGESEILSRIDSSDDPMPPQDAEKQLSDEERELIRNWILQGGQYARHWSFVAPVKADRLRQHIGGD